MCAKWVLGVCDFGESFVNFKMSAADVESKLEECLAGGVPEEISENNIAEHDGTDIKPKVKAKTIEKKSGEDHFRVFLHFI